MYTIKTKIVLQADSKTFEWESIDKWNIMIEEALEGLDGIPLMIAVLISSISH
jgi:hypothetical protein